MNEMANSVDPEQSDLGLHARKESQNKTQENGFFSFPLFVKTYKAVGLPQISVR